MTRNGVPRRTLAALGLVAAALATSSGMAASLASAAAPPAPHWTITSLSQPTDFSLADNSLPPLRRDRYLLRAINSGSSPTDGSTIDITDSLPAGLTAESIEMSLASSPVVPPVGVCAGATTVSCAFTGTIAPGDGLDVTISLDVELTEAASVLNHASVSGGGPAEAITTEATRANSPETPFGFRDFDFAVNGFDGMLDTQAGEHPYAVTTTLDVNTVHTHPGESSEFGAMPVSDLKDIVADLPPGFVGNPQATPQCSELDLQTEPPRCPAASQVGTVTVLGRGGLIPPAPLYNIVPERGYPAEFGFDILGRTIMMYANVRSGSDYGVRVTVAGIPRGVELSGVLLSFWGVPADRNGSGVPRAAFFTTPSDCSGGPLTTKISTDSWENPAPVPLNPDGSPNFNAANFSDPRWATATSTSAAPSGCDQLQFQPTIAVQPDNAQADAPAGLSVDLKLPQSTTLPPVLATPDLKKAVVTLPLGMSVNPSAADGLQGCSPGQIGLIGTSPAQFNTDQPSCPEPSKIGTVEIHTPLLADPLKGSVYLARQNDNAFGSLLAIYLAVDDPTTGVIVKLAGHVVPDPVTGQLTTTFDNNPQLPFDELKLDFKGGPRAPLVNPGICGTYATMTELTPWSAPQSGPPATPGSNFEISQGCHGAQFSPAFSAGTVNPQAGAFSPFTLTFSRSDQDQTLGGITVRTPPGLLGMLSKVPLCGEEQANAGTCSSASQIGHTTVGAGAGSDPIYLPVAGQAPNPVYLTTGYKGAPFGLSVVVPAIAGPFNLGTVVVRAAINVDPHTSQITITSDPLPTILDGIPLQVRTVNVTVDRAGFMFNPTNCEALSVGATITSTQGATAGVSSQFEAANCANLPFKPAFSASTQAKTSKANGASLVVKVAQKPGEANIHKVNLQLPLALPSRLTTLQKACTEAQFNSNPAGCPPGAVVGTATALTPVLSVPLTGPAYLVSHGGAAFPDVVFLLQGEGVRIDLVGNTDIKKGITFSRFETVPDAPISSFETSLPEGPHSVLAANGSLCSQKLVMPTTIVGQNGAQVTQSTKITASGCKAVTISKRRLAGKSVVLSFLLTAKGTVTVTGPGLKRYRKTLAAGSHQITVALSKTGLSERRRHRKITINVALRSGAKVSGSTTRLKL
jgi:hypothetical protein